NMTQCHPWLTCVDINTMILGDLIGFGAVKQVYKTTWNGHTLAYNAVNNDDYVKDFRMGLELLKELSPSEYIVQLVGFCSSSNVFLTEFYPLGNALNIHSVLRARKEDTHLKVKFHLCISYVKILDFLHDGSDGKRVMCDTSTLDKTLEQYLITSSLELVLNDLDALPIVGIDGIVCGHKELYGKFVSPEQKWPYSGLAFKNEQMVPYDEKSDIWKIPSVCNYFLGEDEAAKAFRYHIHPIHSKCRRKRPVDRPSAIEVLKFYELVLYTYFDIKASNEKLEL
ncbi:hypothetical protein SK128_005701, partial [Halocaridina rubra]